MDLKEKISSLPDAEYIIYAEKYNLNIDNSMYYVVEGDVNVYIQTEVGEYQSLKGIMRFKSGDIFFGVYTNRREKLIAKNGMNTLVLKISIEDIVKLSEAFPEELTKLVDAYINYISTVPKIPRLSKAFINVMESDQTPSDEGGCLSTARRVKWISLHERPGYFVSDESMMVYENRYFPLTRLTWVQTPNANIFTTRDTRSIIQISEIYNEVVFYTGIILQLILLDLENLALFENIQLFDRLDSKVKLFNQSQAQLLSVKYPQQTHQIESTTDDVLMQAMIKVAQLEGIAFTPISKMFSALSVEDKLKEACYKNNLGYRIVYLRKRKWFRRNNGTLIAFQGEHKPLVLIPKDRGGYECFDPITQTQVKLSVSFAKTLSPKAYYLYRPIGKKTILLNDIFRYSVRNTIKEFGALILLSLSIGILSLFFPVVTEILFDTVIPFADQTVYYQLTIAMIVIIISLILFEIVRGLVLIKIESIINYKVQTGLWIRILRLPHRFFERYATGELLGRVGNLIEVRQLISESVVVHTLITLIFSIFSFGLMFFYSRILAGYVLFYIIVWTLIIFGLSKLKLAYERRLVDLQGQITHLLSEIINGIEKIRTQTAEGAFFYFWAQKYARYRKKSLKSKKVSLLISNMIEVVPILSIALIYGMFHFSDLHGTLSPGEFLAFMAAYTQFTTTFTLLFHQLNDIIRVIPLCERMKIFFQEEVMLETQGKEQVVNLSGLIDVNSIAFTYPEAKTPILKNVSFSARPGQFIAIVGGSGSGKSTLLKLLLGFEKPSAGAIFYDNRELDHLDLGSLRRRMGVVLQDESVFPGTIYSNLTAFTQLTPEAAWDLLDKVGLASDVENMPMQLQTAVTAEGIGLSGGQIQRLLIARALASQPQILLLDEATSALDNITQTAVMRSLYDLKVTRIVIAHRLSTIRFADEILVLKEGKIVEAGTFEELLKLHGEFRRLAQRQIL